MSDRGQWLFNFGGSFNGPWWMALCRWLAMIGRDVPLKKSWSWKKAALFRADAVFFEAARDGKPAIAQAFVYRSEGPAVDPGFAEVHRRLWSWGGVPLVYRVTNGLVQLFRCAHRPDFEKGSKIIFKPRSKP